MDAALGADGATPAAGAADRVDISVVIPVRDGAATIGEQLEALSEQAFDGTWEVVVADNGSTDDTVARVLDWRDRLPDLRVVDASRAAGVNVARNDGIRASRGRAWVLCDADDVVAPGWLAGMSRAIALSGFATGRLLPFDRASFPPNAYGTPPQASRSRGYLAYAHGCTLGATHEAFAIVGGFDEGFAGGGDDVDFSWRLQQAGFRLVVASDAFVHYRRRTRTRDMMIASYRYQRSGPLLYRRHGRHGMPRRGIAHGIRTWGHLLLSVPRAMLTTDGRQVLLIHLADAAGRVGGSLAHRTLYL